MTLQCLDIARAGLGEPLRHAGQVAAVVWPLGINHSTSKLEKSERARRRNENDDRLLAEFSSLVVDYCKASKLDHAQRAEFSRDILGFLHEK